MACLHCHLPCFALHVHANLGIGKVNVTLFHLVYPELVVLRPHFGGLPLCRGAVLAFRQIASTGITCFSSQLVVSTLVDVGFGRRGPGAVCCW